ENHVLRWHDDRLTRRWRQNVIGGHHQRARFQLCLNSQGHMHGHLVTVKVRVIGCANQRVELDRFTFDQHWLKRLDAQTVQSRSAVQQHRVFANHFVENVPHHWLFTLYHFLGSFNGGGQTTQFQFAEDERLEQFKCHLLRQTALVQTQSRTRHNYGTPRVIDALTQQVLTEAALLTFDHVCQRLQRTLVGASNGPAATAVVQQGVYRFLQHALFVAHNDVRRIEVKQTLQSVIAVDDATIKVVQIRSRETTAVQW